MFKVKSQKNNNILYICQLRIASRPKVFIAPFICWIWSINCAITMPTNLDIKENILFISKEILTLNSTVLLTTFAKTKSWHRMNWTIVSRTIIHKANMFTTEIQNAHNFAYARQFFFYLIHASHLPTFHCSDCLIYAEFTLL